MRVKKIVIIDYGVGNTYSVACAVSYLGYKVRISDQLKHIQEADALILPGVGAFNEAMKNLKARNLDKILNREVIDKKKPILGICLGMQVLATHSTENGKHLGLNWIEGEVIRLELSPRFAVPHVGWNNIAFSDPDPLFNKNKEHSNFYFDHSYHMVCDPKYVAAYCDYGIKVTAAVKKGHICGVQFHPEKSQTNGLKLFRSFLNSVE